MDIWEIYHNSFERELNHEELDFLDTMIQKYPYFAMARFLKAKAIPTTTNIGLASAYASSRPLFKAFMEGNKSVRETVIPTTMEKGETTNKSSSAHQKHEPFSILDMKSEAVKHATLPEFNIGNLNYSPKFQGFLDFLIKEKTKKHLQLPHKIRKELKEADASKKSVVATETDDLIQQFLNNNPKIRKPLPGEELSSVASFAEKSVSMDEEIVSETLAKIHLQQNNKQEALRIYKKLSLLFPEKSAYFDAQILAITKE